MPTPKKLPPKARVEGGGRVTPKGGPSSAGKPAPAAARADRKAAKADAKADKAADKADKAAPAKARRKKPEADVPITSSRYTPPSARDLDLPSPMWVPILMFTLFGLGMLVIFLNYVELLPGSVSNWYLLVGLGLILGGIITATQYR